MVPKPVETEGSEVEGSVADGADEGDLSEKDDVAPSSTSTSTTDAPQPLLLVKNSSKPVVYTLPENELLDLAASLPSLAPRSRPGALVRSLQSTSRGWTSMTLGWGSKTYAPTLLLTTWVTLSYDD